MEGDAEDSISEKDLILIHQSREYMIGETITYLRPGDSVPTTHRIIDYHEINGARDCTKTNTTNLATFKAPEAGLLGYIAGGRHYFIKKTAMHHTVHTEFDVRDLDVLPRVDIVYSYINADDIMVRAAMAAGAKGIVHAGSGNGSVHDDTLGALFDARDHGVAIVRASRVGNGVVTEDCEEWTEAGLLDAATLNPQKSRILLQLGLTITDDPIQLQRMFYEY
jgi:L-asparaginase